MIHINLFFGNGCRLKFSNSNVSAQIGIGIDSDPDPDPDYTNSRLPKVIDLLP